MKKIMFMTMCTCMAIACNAKEQKIEVPSVVSAALSAKYADVKELEWSIEKDGVYEAEFEMNGKDLSALFTTEGVWLETEMEVKKNDLPESVRATIAKELEGLDVDEFEKVTKADGTETYEMEAEVETKYEVAIDPTGKMIKKELIEKKKNSKEEKE